MHEKYLQILFYIAIVTDAQMAEPIRKFDSNEA
jgi:hypothetical protein